MTEPINFDRPICFEGKMGTNSGIGPAASFARAFADFYGEDIGLVPCAEGGSSLDDWAPGGQLFLNACCQAKLAENVGELTPEYSGIRARRNARIRKKPEPTPGGSST